MIPLLMLAALIAQSQPADSCLVVASMLLTFRDASRVAAKGYQDSSQTCHQVVTADTTAPYVVGKMIDAPGFRSARPSPVKIVLAPRTRWFGHVRGGRLQMQASADGGEWIAADSSQTFVFRDVLSVPFDLRPWAGWYVRWIVNSNLCGCFRGKIFYLKTRDQLAR